MEFIDWDTVYKERADGFNDKFLKTVVKRGSYSPQVRVLCVATKEAIQNEQTKTIRRWHGTKREDGRWEGRIVIGHKANGDSIFRYIYADTQKELTANSVRT